VRGLERNARRELVGGGVDPVETVLVTEPHGCCREREYVEENGEADG
jgi:hypothetical protein